MGLFDSNKKFIEAAKAGDEATVLRYLKKYWYFKDKVDLTAKDEAGMTAMGYAAQKGHVGILKQMQRYHMNMDAPDKDGHSPLILAILSKQPMAARTLIGLGANVNTHASDYIYPLHYAAYAGDIDMAAELIRAGSEINPVIVANGYTPLHWALNQGHATMVEYLLKEGARTDIPDKSGKTALDIAKAKGAHMEKIVSAATAQRPVISSNDDTAEKWVRTGKRLTHVAEHPEINRRITEIFNFESRERTILAENLKTGQETLNAPESFDNIAEDALRKAFAEFKKLGGEADESAIIGVRKAPPRPFRP